MLICLLLLLIIVGTIYPLLELTRFIFEWRGMNPEHPIFVETTKELIGMWFAYIWAMLILLWALIALRLPPQIDPSRKGTHKNSASGDCLL